MTRLNREQCTCDQGFTSRGRTDPQCRACSTDVNAAIDEVERLSRICDEQVASIDALDRECHRLKEDFSKLEVRARLAERHSRDLRRLAGRVLKDVQLEGCLTDQVIYDIEREVGR